MGNSCNFRKEKKEKPEKIYYKDKITAETMCERLLQSINSKANIAKYLKHEKQISL